MSRRLKPAVIISRLFFAALISLSRLLFLFEILAIGDLSFETLGSVFEPRLGFVDGKYFVFEGAVKRDLTG